MVQVKKKLIKIIIKKFHEKTFKALWKKTFTILLVATFQIDYVGNGDPRTDEAYEDIGRRARKRYKKLIEDGYEVESRHLSTLVEGLAKRFKLPKETIKTIMGEFGGTIEELYIDIKHKKNRDEKF